MKLNLYTVAATALLSGLALSSIAAPKNVILMVSDGWSYNTIKATNNWNGISQQRYQQSDFTHYAMTTYSAGVKNGTPAWGYDPSQAWSNGTFNTSYLKQRATDSASAITAMVSGTKIYDNQLNIATDGSKLTTYQTMARWLGKSTGSVSTVNWTHATPAGIGAHNVSRNDYAGIAAEMINESGLDVIMGAGNPMYDDNGNVRTTPNYGNVGETNWNNLVNGNTPYSLIQSRSEFQALANGATPNKVVGTFQAYSTAQQSRSGYNSTDTPGSDAFNANVPTMSELALGALNVLDNNANGFFVMMEGGAIDWANHANQGARTIEEQTDFDNSVNAVVNWVETSSSWDDTLLIITGDHDCGLITGPNGELEVIDNGAGNMPGMKYQSGSHTNALIPLFTKGAGSELFANYATGIDPVRGNYIDNTDIFKVMTTATSVPEPGTIAAVGFGLVTLIAGIRRRK